MDEAIVKKEEKENIIFNRAFSLLVRGPVLREECSESTWEMIVENQGRIRKYLEPFQATIQISDEDRTFDHEYAIVKPINTNEEEECVKRQELSPLMSWSLVILLKMYRDGISKGQVPLIPIKEKEFIDELKEYCSEETDQKKLEEKIRKVLRNIQKLKIIRQNGSLLFIHPVIEAYVDLQYLEKMDKSVQETKKEKESDKEGNKRILTRKDFESPEFDDDNDDDENDDNMETVEEE